MTGPYDGTDPDGFMNLGLIDHDAIEAGLGPRV